MRMETRYLRSPQLKPEVKKEMTDEKFIKFAKAAIKKQYNSEMDDEKVHLVWFSKNLQNFKGLFVTDAMDSKYFEVTYNGEKNEIYLDIYEKKSNKVYDVNL